MVYLVSKGERTANIELDGNETEIVFSENYTCFEVMNYSESDILMSLKQGAESGDDGTLIVKAGQPCNYPHEKQTNRLYLTGTGECTVLAKRTPIPSFKKKQEGGEEGDTQIGWLRAVIDSDTGTLRIVSEDRETKALSDYSYTYEYVTLESEIKMVDSEGNETVKKFFQKVITALYNSSRKKIMRTQYDAQTGKIQAFFDDKSREIYLREW